MKRSYITALILIVLAGTGFGQANTDYIFFGDNRPGLPGLELMNSIFSVNPAKAALAVHNSLSFSTVLFPGEIASGLIFPGLYYSLTIPNFTVINITQARTCNAADGSPLNLQKDLLGLQFGIALQDFVNTDSFKFAGGVSLYKLRNMELSGSGITTESTNFDVGFFSSLYGLNLEVVVPNLFLIENNAFNFLNPAMNLIFKLGSKIMLDVDFELSLSTANNYALPGNAGNIEFIGGLNFRRYFLSNSLRTGVGLEAFIDLEDEENQMPVIRYHIAVSYTPFNNSTGLGRDITASPAAGDRPLSLLELLIQNLTLNFGTTMVVNSITGSAGFVPVIQLGITKFY